MWPPPSQASIPSCSRSNRKCRQNTHSHNHSRRLIHSSNSSLCRRRGSGPRSSGSRTSRSPSGRSTSGHGASRRIGSGSRRRALRLCWTGRVTATARRNSDVRKQFTATFIWNSSSECGNVRRRTRFNADKHGIGRAHERCAGAVGECLARFIAFACRDFEVRCLATGDALALALGEGRGCEEESCDNGAGEMHLVGEEDIGILY
jgi:hypothetical protein